jgi:hypothetical protein
VICSIVQASLPAAAATSAIPHYVLPMPTVLLQLLLLLLLADSPLLLLLLLLLPQGEEVERLQVQLKEAQQQATAAQGREEEARAQGHEYAERARRAETLAEEFEAQISTVGPPLPAHRHGCPAAAAAA